MCKWFGLLSILLLVACDQAPDTPTVALDPNALATAQILRKGNGAEPQTLDPHKAEGVPSSHILRDLFEGLMSETPKGELTPGAAERYTISDDGLTYTFHLRPNAKWSNGDSVVAEDFAFGLRRSVDPATLSNYSQILAPILNAEAIVAGDKPPAALGVRAVDDVTLEITLKAPTPYFLGLLTHTSSYPMHQDSVESHGKAFSRPGKLVSNGAYTLSEWTVQSHIKLTRNAYYWNNERTHINEVFYYPTEDQSTELSRYRADELDWTDSLPVKQLDWIEKHLGQDLHIATYLGTYYFGFNNTKPPFKDNLELRQALNMALDRTILTERVSAAGEKPAYTWIPPMQNYYVAPPAWSTWPRAEQIAEAKRLYKAAGYSDADPLSITLMYNTNENHKRMAVAAADMWKRLLGVNVEMINQEWKVFLDTRKRKEDTQVFRAGWIGDYQDPYTFAELMHSEHGINDTGYASEAYDALLAQASVELDAINRMDLLAQAEQQLLADQPIMPVYFYVTKRVVKPWVHGFTPNLMDHHFTKDLKILAH